MFSFLYSLKQHAMKSQITQNLVLEKKQRFCLKQKEFEE